jgi:hypothetical protein
MIFILPLKGHAILGLLVPPFHSLLLTCHIPFPLHQNSSLKSSGRTRSLLQSPSHPPPSVLRNEENPMLPHPCLLATPSPDLISIGLEILPNDRPTDPTTARHAYLYEIIHNTPTEKENLQLPTRTHHTHRIPSPSHPSFDPRRIQAGTRKGENAESVSYALKHQYTSSLLFI